MVFHWGLEQMDAMPLTELMDWRQRARERWELTHGARPKTASRTGGA